MTMCRLVAFRVLLLYTAVVVVRHGQAHPAHDATASTVHVTTAEFQGAEISDEPKSCPSTNVIGSGTEDGTLECADTNRTTHADTSKVDETNEENHPQCGLYLAESTIPGAGLGAFTGIDRQPGDIIGRGEVMVPIYDVSYHLQALGPKIAKRSDWDYLDPTRDYVWYGADLGMQYETAHPQDHVSGIAYGLDAAINCHLALYNADKEYTSYDFAHLHRSLDPGIGAFTPYHNASTFAARTLVAGSELFKSYGDQWFVDRTETFGLLPLTKDYTIVEAMLKKLQEMLDYGKIPFDIRLDLYERFILANPYMNTSRTLSTVPKKYDDFQFIAQYGILEYYQKSAIHTVDFLEQHGRCVDTIEPRRSTIRQAGRGAFATRSFKKDAIVIGTPVFYYASDDFFKLYQGNWITKNEDDFHSDQHVGYQLMYNYCWRHEQYPTVSSIVLCPYGMNVNYINHNQSLANVRVQWAKDGEMNHNATLLHSHPREMYYSDAPKLWLDFVALRDIEVGEEIFMDYGNVWEQAWQKHAARWNRDNYYPTDYVSAYDWNRMNAKAMLRTRAEQEEAPYPDHFMMICLPEIADLKYTELLTSTVCERTWNPSTLGLPCYIFDREQQSDGSYWYQVKYRNSADSTVWTESDWIVREAIKFVNKPYTNDIFLDDAFRHPIGIPDDIFPKAWRGVYLSPLPKEERKSKKRKKVSKPWLTTIMSLFSAW